MGCSVVAAREVEVEERAAAATRGQVMRVAAVAMRLLRAVETARNP